VTELDWGEAAPLEGAGGAVLTAACLPCQHWSRRTLLDRNTSLWASWSLRAGGASVFFGGDTGYAGVFKTLGERAGPFDLALIGIGACVSGLCMPR
jgi:N-acyl-phosphatidylethanolamine-hydrolysing phospholipase D